MSLDMKRISVTKNETLYMSKSASYSFTNNFIIMLAIQKQSKQF